MSIPRKQTRDPRTTDNRRTVNLKVSPTQIRAWENAAARSQMSRQAWCMAILDAAAGSSELPEHLKRVVK